MKRIIYSFSIVIILAISLAALQGCYSTSPSTSGNQYSGPDWAPDYEPGVRYYYIPDIETYYDVSNHYYVYMDQGRWITSSGLPPMYRDYDLYNGYQVILDRKVYEPWRYHQNYVSSYPRYYYRSKYADQNGRRVRGYNENARKPVYVTSSDRSRRSETTNTPSRDVNNGTAHGNRSSDNNNRRVGEPVKVTPDMRQPSQTGPSGTSSRRDNPGTGNRTSSRDVQQQRSTPTTPPPSVRRDNESRKQEDSKTEPSGISPRRDNSTTNTRTETSTGDAQQQRSTPTTPPPSVRRNNESRMQEDSKTEPSGISPRRENPSTSTRTETSTGDVQQQRSTPEPPAPAVRGDNERKQQDSKTDSKSSSDERRTNRRR